ncbi:MAG: hypothetical protein R3253_13585 [Longimicrobiales bacterium]|nr:hypothetical protein [Longimicrobiales bacterium]
MLRLALDASVSAPLQGRDSRVSALRGLLLVLGLFLWGCGGAEPRDLTTLAVVDSLYVAPEMGEPFTGPVYRDFADQPGMRQLEGALEEGVWHGELRVYHPNGRVRYMGSFHRGDRCGPWTENADSTRNQSIYEDLVDEIESLGIYPPCPER